MNLALIGMPGSGKTTVSRILGEKYGFEVTDTDAIVEKKYGKIADIFEKYGEEYFRGLETRAVKEACGGDGRVISTGGGCILRGQNRMLLAQNCKIIYLRATVETLLERLRGDNSRPLLKGDAEGRLKALYAERAEIYSRSAHLIVDTDVITPERTAEVIMERVK